MVPSMTMVLWLTAAILQTLSLWVVICMGLLHFTVIYKLTFLRKTVR